MIIVDFQIKNNISKSKYFQKAFLMTNIKIEIIFKIFFFKFSNIDILFNNKIFM